MGSERQALTARPGVAPARVPEVVAVPAPGLPDAGERVPDLAVPTVGLWFATLGLFAAEAYGVLRGDWPVWLTVAMGAAVTFLMFSVLHESIHHAISTNTRVNTAFGHLATPFVVAYASAPMVKFIHIEHHRNTNESMATDPDAWTECGPRWQLPLRWMTLDLWYTVFYLRRIRRRPRSEVLGAVGAFTVTWAAFAALIGAGYGMQLVILYLIPQRIGILFLGWWFDYLPHHGLTDTQRENRYRATRVRVGAEWWMTPLFVYQNYHLVHHLHPSVPFYRYVRAWRRNETAYLDRNAAISTVFGRSLSVAEYRTWRRLTDALPTPSPGSARRPVFHPLRVESIRPLTADTVQITFAVPPDLRPEYRYLAGQHVTVRALVGGREVRRSYSICTPESAQELRIAVKRIDGGAFSTYAVERLEVGDILDVMTPAGNFGAALQTRRSTCVAVAAGSGITPVLSIVATALEARPDTTITLVYGNRSDESIMLAAELADLERRFGHRLRVHHVLSRSGPDPRRIDGPLVVGLTGAAPTVDAWFLCGPEAMVADVRAAVLERGAADGDVHTELFHTEAAAPSEQLIDLDSSVTVVLDGAASCFPLRSTAEVVLDAALSQGLDVPYSCAGGACGTCRAKVTSGSAVMEQNHALSPQDVADGYVLTCQAHPTSEQLRLDYDC